MRFIPAIAAVGLALAGPTMVAAQVYDPSADFSATNNPNGVWSYGWTNTLSSTFRFDTPLPDSSGLDFWVGGVSTGSPPGFFPYVAHNGTPSAILYVGAVPYPPGQLGMHPGPDGEYAVIRWTAPVAAAVTVSGSYYPLNPGTTTDVHVLKNGNSALDGLLNSANPVTFCISMTVVAGDTIDFAVGYGSDGTYYGDSTGLSATIAVPEPVSLALLGAAGGGWALWRRRKALNRQ